MFAEESFLSDPDHNIKAGSDASQQIEALSEKAEQLSRKLAMRLDFVSSLEKQVKDLEQKLTEREELLARAESIVKQEHQLLEKVSDFDVLVLLVSMISSHPFVIFSADNQSCGEIASRCN